MNPPKKTRPVHHNAPIVQDCIKAAKQCSGVKVIQTTPLKGGSFQVTFQGPKGKEVRTNVTAQSAKNIATVLNRHFV